MKKKLISLLVLALVLPCPAPPPWRMLISAKPPILKPNGISRFRKPA